MLISLSYRYIFDFHISTMLKERDYQIYNSLSSEGVSEEEMKWNYSLIPILSHQIYLTLPASAATRKMIIHTLNRCQLSCKFKTRYTERENGKHGLNGEQTLIQENKQTYNMRNVKVNADQKPRNQ